MGISSISAVTANRERPADIFAVDQSAPVPLAVDLDGTLIETDLLVETAFEYLGREPQGLFNLFLWLSKGKAHLKHELARRSTLDVSLLPYNPAVLEHMAKARSDGRDVFVASASDGLLVEQIAHHVGCSGWFASDGLTNLSSHHKGARLSEAFGERAFDYVGNEAADLFVWQRARRAIMARSSPAIARRLKASGIEHEILPGAPRSLRAWIRLLRPHQWAKNTLVFVPLLTSHLFNATALLHSVGAFVAFSLCASSVYIVNDLVDVEADRKHPTKKLRPFASGTVPVLGGIVAAPLLAALAFALAFMVSGMFAAVLAVYLAITSAYSFYLKRKMLVDVVTLSLLYTVRVIAGAAAIDVFVSEWLLGFSTFLFLSLALIKRYSEMALRFDSGLPDPQNRAYRGSDLPILSALSAAAGFNAVIVFSLYLASDTVKALYERPIILWLSCPLLIYWTSRMLLLSHRRQLHDDPVVFALRDRNSLLTIALIAALSVLAI
jgi:4-hydroxybenzoate polyprenyltransferase/phosphoserine phosphatase